jgi:hypothetical protein
MLSNKMELVCGLHCVNKESIIRNINFENQFTVEVTSLLLNN